MTVAPATSPTSSSAGALAPRSSRSRTQAPPAFAASPVPVEALPVSAYSPHYVPGSQNSEVWSYVAWFPSGHTFHIQYMISNIGPGDFTGLVIAYFLLPDGETVAIKNSRDRDRWEDLSDARGPALRIADHSLRVDHPDHDVVVHHGELGHLELRGVTTSRMVSPGRVHFSEGDWYEVNAFAPRMEMEGSMRLPDGEELTLEDGWGIGYHSVSSIADQEVGVAHFRLDTFDREPQLSLVRFTGPDGIDHRPYGFLMLFEDGRIGRYVRDFGGRFFDVRPESEDPHYPLPAGFRVGGVAGAPEDGDPGIRVDASLRLQERTEILDFLNSRVLRFVLKMITRPILFQFRADYEIEVASDVGHSAADAQGTGFAALYVLEDPPRAY